MRADLRYRTCGLYDFRPADRAAARNGPRSGQGERTRAGVRLSGVARRAGRGDVHELQGQQGQQAGLRERGLLFGIRVRSDRTAPRGVHAAVRDEPHRRMDGPPDRGAGVHEQDHPPRLHERHAGAGGRTEKVTRKGCFFLV